MEWGKRPAAPRPRSCACLGERSLASSPFLLPSRSLRIVRRAPHPVRPASRRPSSHASRGRMIPSPPTLPAVPRQGLRPEEEDREPHRQGVPGEGRGQRPGLQLPRVRAACGAVVCIFGSGGRNGEGPRGPTLAEQCTRAGGALPARWASREFVAESENPSGGHLPDIRGAVVGPA